MTEDRPQTQDQVIPRPRPALKALDVMVGVWDFQGRDFTANAEITGKSTFEWLEGGFFLVHRFDIDYAGRNFSGIELSGYDEKSGHLKTHVFSSQGTEPVKYTWEVDDTTFTNWFGDIGAANRYKGRFSDDRSTPVGQWEWPGGGYEATMVRIQS